MVDLLFGCHHKKITRPITPVHKVGTAPGDTYAAFWDAAQRLHSYESAKLIPTPLNSSAADSFQRSSDFYLSLGR